MCKSKWCPCMCFLKSQSCGNACSTSEGKWKDILLWLAVRIIIYCWVIFWTTRTTPLWADGWSWSKPVTGPAISRYLLISISSYWPHFSTTTPFITTIIPGSQSKMMKWCSISGISCSPPCPRLISMSSRSGYRSEREEVASNLAHSSGLRWLMVESCILQNS